MTSSTSTAPNTERWDNSPDFTPRELKNLSNLKNTYDKREISLTPEQQEFVDTKLSSKLWRLNNLYTIMDKDGVKKKMRLNNAQMKVLTKFRHNKKIILKSRQQGLSTLYIAYNLDDCLFKAGYQAGIQSYGLDESEKLSKRALLMWDELDQEVKDIFGLNLVTNNSKGMSFSNGSVLKIGNFRGDTLQSLHVSELAKIAKKFPEKAKELKTGAFQAVGKNNKITVESTSEGKSGLFHEIWVKATSLEARGLEPGPFDFQPIFLSWVYDLDCSIDTEKEITENDAKYFTWVEEEIGIVLTPQQKWWYVSKLDELGEDMKREYPTTPDEAFEQSVEGTYYKHEFKGLKILDIKHDPNLLVHSAFDLGMNDTFSIIFFQLGDERVPRIIGEYMNSGHGLAHYKDVFNALEIKLGWTHGETYVPHDSKVRELIADKTRWTAMKELGFKPILVTRHKIQDGIEATRQFLKTCEIDRQCKVTIDAIQNYRKKYDERFSVYLDAPVHDEHSHTADALRYLAVGLKNRPITKIYVKEYRAITSTKLLDGGYDI
jgi:hypothetical protein